MERILCLVIGYLFGSIFQSGYWLCKMRGVDIRTCGSGNAGTSNVIRSMGKKIGYLTYAFDMGKVLLAIVASAVILTGRGSSFPLLLVIVWTGAGAVIGHDYPFYLHFKGGKGIASESGIMLALIAVNWHYALIPAIAIATFLIVMYSSRYISLASMCMTCVFAAEMLITALLGLFPLAGSQLVEIVVIPILLAALSIFQHRGNIGRLKSGTERKIKNSKQKV